MLIKIGECSETIKLENVESCIPSLDNEILESFKKTAMSIKKIAPKAEDFLYFSGVMMHAAESSAINDDGTIKLNASGEPVKVSWDKSNNTYKWVTNDSNIKPFKNNNGDIFPEEELIKAYKKWNHKPLCIDHKSSSVDHVRGFIVDTYYDRNLKRVVALCALDRKNYPDLARKIETGYQTSLSMGTGVSAAICTDCATVASRETEFCKHMKTKSGYGEINIGLNPIELSIVVNGADPKAHIKHIIAAANTLNNYIDNKQQQLNKLAESNFSATINFSNNESSEHDVDSKAVTYNISSSDLANFKEEFEKACSKLEQINDSIKLEGDESHDMNNVQSCGTEQMDETETTNVNLGSPSHANRYALNIESDETLRKITSSIESKLIEMQKTLSKLSNIQEENMSGKNINKQGYYQGTEEPTPGQAQYTKDPLNEKARMTDKHMVGEAPFPDVGAVDELYPGTSSADKSDLELKKMLARAESEQRAIRRNAAVALAKKALENKTAYFQGTEEPAQGERKYPAEKLNEDARMDDKHMVGKKPFPEVGKVDELYPEDLKTKEMIQRASYRARFIKAAKADGSQDSGKSAWEVFHGDKLLLTASVNDLSANRPDMFYGSIATKEFGTKLIEQVKVLGADKVRAMVKSAQDVPAATQVPEAAPAALTPAMPAMPEAQPVEPVEMPKDDGKSGDVKEQAVDLAEKARDVTSDLVEVVKELTNEKAEMGDESVSDTMATSASSKDLFSMKKEINSELTSHVKKAIVKLTNSVKELNTLVGLQSKSNDENKELVNSIIEDTVDETKTAIAEGMELMSYFVKYARGNEALVKRAKIEQELKALAEGEMSDDLMNAVGPKDDPWDDSDEGELEGLSERNFESEDPYKEVSDDDVPHDHDSVGAPDDDTFDEPVGEEDEKLEEDEDSDLGLEELDFGRADDVNNVDVKRDTVKDVPAGALAPDTHIVASFNSKSGRAALRAKLAADATGKQDDGKLTDMGKARFSDVLDHAHKHIDEEAFEVKPSDDMGHVHTVQETNKSMMDLAKAPAKVRKDAAAIQKLISEGKLDEKDLPTLVAEGLDKEAVAYWKKFYGQADGGSEFASELVKEHVKAEMENDINTYKVKIARAYELAYDMKDRGLCHADRNAISAQVDEIMKFNDESFESLKRVVARHAPIMSKQASRIPQVGLLDDSVVKEASDDNLYSQLSAALSKTTRKMF